MSRKIPRTDRPRFAMGDGFDTAGLKGGVKPVPSKSFPAFVLSVHAPLHLVVAQKF